MMDLIFNRITTFALFDIGKACNPHVLDQQNQFFGFPHWWKYITKGETDALGKCMPKVNMPDDIWTIALAVVEMLMYAAGILAIVYLIIAGVAYMTAEGNSEKAAAARKRIINTVVGLIIILIATSVISFIGQRVG